MEHAPDAIPSATVIVLRDAAAGLEVLMLQRSESLAFAAGVWAFPGGRVDADDARGGDVIAAARAAAVREAAEEAAIDLAPESLVLLSRWTPPPKAPRRFSTFFLVGRAPDTAVMVDGGEISQHRWMRPAEVLTARDRNEMELMPPTWVCLWRLSHFESVDAALTAFRREPVESFETHIGKVPEGLVAMWHGDAGYAESNPHASGPRHRLWMVESGWRFERDNST